MFMYLNKLKFILLILTLVLLFVSSKAYQNQALSFHFVDEEDNIVLGSYLLKGEKLYSDLFSHHQPLAYTFSAGIQKATDANTLFLLIKRHREAVIIWSVFWSVFLVLRFGLPLFITVLIYEPLKIFLLGNLFLSESLVVYPLVYLISWVLTVHKHLYKLEIPLIGFCLSLCFFLLSPLWPLLLFLSSLIIIKLRRSKIGNFWWLGILIGAILPIGLTLNFVSLPDYFYNAFYINFNYYIPITSKDSWIITALNAFSSPLLAFTNFQNNNATLQVIRILSVALLLNCLFLIKQNNWRLLMMIVLFLGLANIRFVSPGAEGYSGFHIIPWFMTVIVLTSISTLLIWKQTPRSLFKIPVLVLLMVLITVVFRESTQTLLAPRDKNLDFYINYSRQADFGQAIKIMKDENETLFIAPDEWLIYWQADISHFTKMVNYYAWMSQVPPIKEPLHTNFRNNPPTYFYCDHCQYGYFGLEEFFYNYQKIKKDGQETNLMVLKKKVVRLSSDQLRQLLFYNFSFN